MALNFDISQYEQQPNVVASGINRLTDILAQSYRDAEQARHNAAEEARLKQETERRIRLEDIQDTDATMKAFETGGSPLAQLVASSRGGSFKPETTKTKEHTFDSLLPPAAPSSDEDYLGLLKGQPAPAPSTAPDLSGIYYDGKPQSPDIRPAAAKGLSGLFNKAPEAPPVKAVPETPPVFAMNRSERMDRSTKAIPGLDFPVQPIEQTEQVMDQPPVYRTASGREVSFDPTLIEGARKSRDDEKASQLESLAGDPRFSPEERRQYLTQAQVIRNRLSPLAAKAVTGATELGSKQDFGEEALKFKAENSEDLQSNLFKQKDKLQADRLASAEKIAAMRKHKAGGFGQGASGVVGGGGTPTISVGEQRALRQTDSTMARWENGADYRNFLRQQRRLEISADNIEKSGVLSNVTNRSAVQEFLGVLRGGVPTDMEMKYVLGTKGWPAMVESFFENRISGNMGEIERSQLREAISKTVDEFNNMKQAMVRSAKSNWREGTPPQLMPALNSRVAARYEMLNIPYTQNDLPFPKVQKAQPGMYDDIEIGTDSNGDSITKEVPKDTPGRKGTPAAGIPAKKSARSKLAEIPE